jgi:hypothetical protein
MCQRGNCPFSNLKIYFYINDSLRKDTAEIEREMAEKSSPGTRQTDGKNLVWFGGIERKLAKLSLLTFTYRSSSELFYVYSAVQCIHGNGNCTVLFLNLNQLASKRLDLG